MEDQKTKLDFKKWLEHLQQESWQLELIISSILLFVLSGADSYVEQWYREIAVHSGGGIVELYGLVPSVLMPAVGIAKVNLVIHIFLRGFWIGCIGLRYVSGEIDVNSLNYRPVFSNYLKKLNLDFDRYLEQLEKVCSIIFSFTFLIIFGVFSFFSFLFLVILGIVFFRSFENSVIEILGRIFVLLMLFSAFLNLLDLLFLGWFRRKKYIAKFFYPFYRLFHLFTFSWIYRPLFYNFIDNKLGRKYFKIVIPYVLLLTFSSGGIGLGNYSFLPAKNADSNWVLSEFYDDRRKLDSFDEILPPLMLPSMEVKENFLPVFLRYEDKNEFREVLVALCPNFKGYERNSIRLKGFEEFKAGMNARESEERGFLNAPDFRADSALTCLSKVFDLKIDSTEYPNPIFHFHQHPQLKSYGILTYLNIESFEKGDHILTVEKKAKIKADSFLIKNIEVPFVKFN